MKRKEDRDKAAENDIIENLLNEEFERLSESCRLIAKEYFIITPREVYLKEKRFLLVVLENGDVYRYGVENGEKNGFILDKNATVCSDVNELALVKKHTDKLHIDKRARAKRITGAAAACIVAFGLAVMVMLFWLGSTVPWMKYVGIAILGIIIVSVIMFVSLSSYKDMGGIAGALYKVSSGILLGLDLFLFLLIPSVLLVMGFVFIIILPSMAVWVGMTALSSIINISAPAILFVALSVGAIISAHYSKPLFGYLSNFLTANGHRYEKYFQEIVEYAYQPGNIQFAVNFFYVLFLVATTISQLQTDGEPIFGKDIDTAVLKSFLVFIAFSNVKAKRDSADFRFSELFRMMYKMWTVHDNTNEEEI